MTTTFPIPQGGGLGAVGASGYPLTCWVVVDGVKVPCTADDLGAGLPTVLDGLSFTWGRSTTVDQPDTETLSATLREQIDPDAITTLDTIHVGSSLEVWTGAEVPATASETMARTDFTGAPSGDLDPAWWTTVDGDTPAASVSTIPGKSIKGAYLTRPNDWDWTTRTAFPPNAFVTDPEAQPDAWDLVPRLLPGQTWNYIATVWVPPGSTARLAAWAYTGPHVDDRAAECTVTGDTTATGTLGQFIGDDDGWVTLTGEITLPDGFDDAGAWIAAGIDLVDMPSPVTWDEAPGTWDDQVLRWIDLQQAIVTFLSIEQTAATERDVLVWSGEVTSLVGQAAGDHAFTTNVTASDLSSILANVKVGDEPWEVMSVADRAAAIMALIPTAPALVIDEALQDTQVSRRDVDAQAPLDLLRDLAQTAGGVLWVTAHATQGAYLWMEDPAERAAIRKFVIDPDTGAISITGRYGNVSGVAVVSAMDILRDPVNWTQDVATVVTQVSVAWLEQVTDEDGQPSTADHTEVVPDAQEFRDRFGIRDLSVSTELITALDAQDLGARILAQSRGTGWLADGLQLDTILLERDIDTVDYPARLTTTLDLLDATTRIGYALTLVDMPEWTPAGAVRSMYVEGGTYTWADHRWQLELTASPSTGQGESATWADFDGTGVTWADFAVNKITWTDAYGTAGPTVEDQERIV